MRALIGFIVKVYQTPILGTSFKLWPTLGQRVVLKISDRGPRIAKLSHYQKIKSEVFNLKIKINFFIFIKF